jgi:vesicle transport through interaction with t-SNAREs protein 1
MDSSPTSLFDSYEQDFQQILQSIREKLEGDGADQRGGMLLTPSLFLSLTPLGPSEQKKASLRRVEMELDEAEEMVRA